MTQSIVVELSAVAKSLRTPKSQALWPA